MMGNGRMGKKMVKEYFITKNVNIKACFYKTNSTDQAYYITVNLMYTKVNFSKTNVTALAL